MVSLFHPSRRGGPLFEPRLPARSRAGALARRVVGAVTCKPRHRHCGCHPSPRSHQPLARRELHAELADTRRCRRQPVRAAHRRHVRVHLTLLPHAGDGGRGRLDGLLHPGAPGGVREKVDVRAHPGASVLLGMRRWARAVEVASSPQRGRSLRSLPHRLLPLRAPGVGVQPPSQGYCHVLRDRGESSDLQTRNHAVHRCLHHADLRLLAREVPAVQIQSAELRRGRHPLQPDRLHGADQPDRQPSMGYYGRFRARVVVPCVRHVAGKRPPAGGILGVLKDISYGRG
mmetsp:Transcript_50360/g.135594  ORF Transcript_50360/g.135594 Transcript_50360/m.135594 type:complete len:287 (-) Transcript_50360:272-1132(-)